jgi:hypothetical protein
MDGREATRPTPFIGPPPKFAGTPGFSNCHGQSVAALAQQYGGLHAAAIALGFPSVPALQNAITAFCGGQTRPSPALTLKNARSQFPVATGIGRA